MTDAGIETKEEFIETQNGMKIQKIVMFKDETKKKKHIVYFSGLANPNKVYLILEK